MAGPPRPRRRERGWQAAGPLLPATRRAPPPPRTAPGLESRHTCEAAGASVISLGVRPGSFGAGLEAEWWAGPPGC